MVAANCGPSREEVPETPAHAVRVVDDATPTFLPTRFESYTVAGGMVTNEANVILQVRQGFLWVDPFGGRIPSVCVVTTNRTIHGA